MVPLGETRKLPPEKVVLMTTGSQGEPTSALVRIAKQEHRDVNIMSGDTVIISATPIPGNELPVSHTIDNLLRQGAKVLYDRIATVHVHGHASQEELKLVLRLIGDNHLIIARERVGIRLSKAIGIGQEIVPLHQHPV